MIPLIYTKLKKLTNKVDSGIPGTVKSIQKGIVRLNPPPTFVFSGVDFDIPLATINPVKCSIDLNFVQYSQFPDSFIVQYNVGYYSIWNVTLTSNNLRLRQIMWESAHSVFWQVIEYY